MTLRLRKAQSCDQGSRGRPRKHTLVYDPSENWIEVATWKGERERIDVSPTGDRWARMAIGVGAELESFIGGVAHDAEPILTGWDGLWAVEITARLFDGEGGPFLWVLNPARRDVRVQVEFARLAHAAVKRVVWGSVQLEPER